MGRVDAIGDGKGEKGPHEFWVHPHGNAGYSWIAPHIHLHARGSRPYISVLKCENVTMKKSRSGFSFCYIHDIGCFVLVCFFFNQFLNIHLPKSHTA